MCQDAVMWLLNTSLVKVHMAWYRTAVEIEIRIKDARSGEEWVEKVKHFETIQNSHEPISGPA